MPQPGGEIDVTGCVYQLSITVTEAFRDIRQLSGECQEDGTLILSTPVAAAFSQGDLPLATKISAVTNASLCFQNADIHPTKVLSNPPKYAPYYHLQQQTFIRISEGLNQRGTTVSVRTIHDIAIRYRGT